MGHVLDFKCMREVSEFVLCETSEYTFLLFRFVEVSMF